MTFLRALNKRRKHLSSRDSVTSDYSAMPADTCYDPLMTTSTIASNMGFHAHSPSRTEREGSQRKILRRVGQVNYVVVPDGVKELLRRRPCPEMMHLLRLNVCNNRQGPFLCVGFSITYYVISSLMHGTRPIQYSLVSDDAVTVAHLSLGEPVQCFPSTRVMVRIPTSSAFLFCGLSFIFCIVAVGSISF